MCEGTWQLKNSRTILLWLKLPLLTLRIWWSRNELENFQSSTDEEEALRSPLLVSVPCETHQKPSSSTSFSTHECRMPFAHLQQADHWRCLTALQIHIRKGLCAVVKSSGFRVFIQAHGLRCFAGGVSLAQLLFPGLSFSSIKWGWQYNKHPDGKWGLYPVASILCGMLGPLARDLVEPGANSPRPSCRCLTGGPRAKWEPPFLSVVEICWVTWPELLNVGTSWPFCWQVGEARPSPRAVRRVHVRETDLFRMPGQVQAHQNCNLLPCITLTPVKKWHPGLWSSVGTMWKNPPTFGIQWTREREPSLQTGHSGGISNRGPLGAEASYGGMMKMPEWLNSRVCVPEHGRWYPDDWTSRKMLWWNRGVFSAK